MKSENARSEPKISIYVICILHFFIHCKNVLNYLICKFIFKGSLSSMTSNNIVYNILAT